MSSIKRTRFMINRKFQLKYVLIITCVIGLMLLVVELHTYLTIKSVLPNILFRPNMLSTGIWHKVKTLNEWLVINSIVYIVLSIFAAIYFSHKIAGPVYNLRRVLCDMLESGDLTTEIKLRKGDELSELAEDLNELIASLRTRINNYDVERETIVADIRSKLQTMDIQKLTLEDQEKLKLINNELSQLILPWNALQTK